MSTHIVDYISPSGNALLTMSSREIADLVGQRHDNVKRTIETLGQRGVIRLPQIEEVSNPGPGPKMLGVYNLDKRSSLIVVAQLCPEFTARIVDRWQELEQQAAAGFTIPRSMPEALRLAADLAEQKAQVEARLAIAAPKAEALDRISLADGSVCITNAAKALGIRPKQLFAWLQKEQWIYRRAGGSGWIGYQSRIQVGLLDHKVTTVERSDGSEKMVEQVLVTPKGLARLAQVFAAGVTSSEAGAHA